MSHVDEIAAAQLEAPHYLKSVTEFGDTHPVHATQDIYSATQIKLVARGVRLDSSLYSHLLNHRLLPPLDQCVTAQNTVSQAALMAEATLLLGQDDWLAAMQASLGEGDPGLPAILGSIPLNPAIAFKLTVMREQRPELFRHSIFVALVSCYIGLKVGLQMPQLERLATAALLHDIGILHIDPALLDPSHHMSESERKHLHAHPITAWMLLSEYPEYTADILDAVLQHHERLDGSGYPRSLQGNRIGRLGQIIAVTEVVASQHDRSTRFGRLRLETILKLNSRRYGQNLIGHLKVFYQTPAEVPPCTQQDKEEAQHRLEQLAAVLDCWKQWKTPCSAAPAVCDFINGRMQDLQMEIFDSGLTPGAADANLSVFGEDGQVCKETGILLDEAVWRITELLREVRHRWPQVYGDEPAFQPIGEWMDAVRSLLKKSDHHQQQNHPAG